MPATTPGGFPYVLPADHPLEYPAMSQQLATLLDQLAAGLSVMSVTGTRANPVVPQTIDLTTVTGSDGPLFTHNGTGIVCQYTGRAQITGRMSFEINNGGGVYRVAMAGDVPVAPGTVIKGHAVWGAAYLRACVNVAGTIHSLNEEYMTATTITGLSVDLTVRPIAA